MLPRLLQLLTKVDFVLAVALGLVLGVRASSQRDLLSPKVYGSAAVIGLLSSLAWWGTICCWIYSTRGDGAMSAVPAPAILPPTILGTEAGVLGLLYLATPWNLVSLAFGFLNAIPALALSWWLIRAHPFHWRP